MKQTKTKRTRIVYYKPLIDKREIMVRFNKVDLQRILDRLIESKADEIGVPVKRC